jgi:protein phosphatase
MDARIDSHGLSETGKVREINKSMLIHHTTLRLDDWTRIVGGTQGHLYLVADGMGGHAEGKKASKMAVNTVVQYVLDTMPWFFHLDKTHEDDLEAELKAALEKCQSKLVFESLLNPQGKNMGTTLTMTYLLWPRIYVVHAGDSRCYLYRQSRLEQITTDHTFAQALVEEGALKQKEAQEHRLSNVLWNAIGGSEDKVRPDVYKASLELDDALLLCTDGLTKHVSDPEIMSVLENGPTADRACQALVDMANDAGGKDNITVVVVYFRKADSSIGTMDKQSEYEKGQELDVAINDSSAEPIKSTNSENAPMK